MGKKRSRRILFDVPFTATAPPLTSESAGIRRIVERRMPAPVEEVTIIDAPDQRLLRAGVVLARHLVERGGEWTLQARPWEPLLPAEQRVALDESLDLPESLARCVRPLTRGATLAPVAVLDVERQAYQFLSSEDEDLGTLLDERVTVEREGLVTARYREAVLTPGPAMTAQQLEFLIASMNAVSATPVEVLPSLQQRLGPPATGLTDFTPPQPLGRDATLEELASHVFAADLGMLVDAQLDLELGRADDASGLNDALATVSENLRGFAHVLDPAWRESLERTLSQLPLGAGPELTSVAHQVTEALVRATHAPMLGDAGREPAGPLLHARGEQGLHILADRCSALEVDSPDQNWEAARLAADQLAVSSEVARALPGRRVTKFHKRLLDVRSRLEACIPARLDVNLDDLTPAEAYEIGRADERNRIQVQGARAKFVKRWPELLEQLTKLQLKARPR